MTTDRYHRPAHARCHQEDIDFEKVEATTCSWTVEAINDYARVILFDLFLSFGP